MRRKFVAVLLFAFAFFPAHSVAEVKARANIDSSVTTSTWALAAVGQNQIATNSPYLLSWSVNNGVAYDFFHFRNLGTTSITALEVMISQTRVGGNGPANEIFFELCLAGNWNSTTNSCSGTVVLLGRGSDSRFNLSAINLATGSQLDIRARTAINGRNNFVTSISTLINREAIRAGETFNS